MSRFKPPNRRLESCVTRSPITLVRFGTLALSCAMAENSDRWPALPYADWKDTCQTLQLWTQVIGKIRLARTPWLNHSWHVTLYVTARGLTTSPIPADDSGLRTLPDRFRFHRSCAVAAHQRRSCPPDRAQADDGGGILRRGDARAVCARHRRAHQRDAERDRRRDPVQPGPRARVLRSRLCQPLLAHLEFLKRGVRAVPHRLSRQGEPGAFLLGQFRSCGDALLRAHRAAPSRRRAEPAR